ncbi:MAG TPA: DNA polymerase Y family protein [Casimicrobiaceae bacterium]|nr:DNA polymerase Y family protein [Casimicrobiaceae bacterium]
MLWTALYFPGLPLSVFARAGTGKVAAVVSSASHRPDVVAANGAAKKRGIVAGLSIAAALALDPEIVIHLRDERAEAAALKSIALWAWQWTSTISIEPPAIVLLEISACLNYFEGLPKLLARIDAGLAALGFSGVIATAPTSLAASLLAQAGQAIAIEHPADLEPRLTSLPVALLDSARPVLDTLTGIGVHTIADVLALPRDGVARRFGQRLLDEIDRARGIQPDPRPLFVPPERYHGQLELPVPVDEAEALLFAAKRLVVELAGFLQGRGAGVTRLRCDLIHEDEPPTAIVLGLAATRKAEHIVNVLRERLAREQLPDRVEAIRLVSEEIAPLPGQDGELFAAAHRHGQNGAQWIERVRARLGDDSVRELCLHADHRPEHAWRYRDTAAARAAPLPADPPRRPLWLLPRPRPLGADLASAQLCLLSGPERIESGWWDGGEIGRDYFVGSDAQGGELWLYRDRGGEWFLHGIFG